MGQLVSINISTLYEKDNTYIMFGVLLFDEGVGTSLANSKRQVNK